MPNSLSSSIYEALAGIRLIDPHTHINPYTPASTTLADLLGYHYYTELAHSSGMPKSQIEEPGIPPDELVRRLVLNLSPIENTAQYRWLIEICRRFFDFDGDRLDTSNWESVYAAAEQKMNNADWPQLVLDQSNVESVFLTNDFDETLDGFDTNTYIPCLRTDDLVFHLAKSETQQRLQECSQVDLDGTLTSLRAALEQRFEHFVSRGARACAISLPPNFEPTPVADGRAKTALNEILSRGLSADPSNQAAVSRHVFWTLAELCDQFRIPFDLMIGVNRGVYVDGVYQGQDLYDSRVSLIQYRELFNAFPDLKFPVSVLASVTNQELVSYAWIFPNVITNGHWWYSNTPSFITKDATARLEAVPCTKQIGYYSDAYKLEFVWPKFDMYRRVLSNILAEQFVIGSRWSEERAIELGRRVLRDNVELVFPKPNSIDQTIANELRTPRVTTDETWIESGQNADADASSFEIVKIEDAAAKPAESLDPLPSEDEIKAVDLDDVELLFENAAIIDHKTLAANIELEPLDVGDLTGDTDNEGTEKIQMLQGDGSFEADEESLKVKPDPMTGELRFPNPSENDEVEPPATETDKDDTLDDESTQ
ncbi:MAG: glucuronate isomerase [Planctomycetota bacterium]|nr:glucuronate isomerase [Planctomycetota bacterium]